MPDEAPDLAALVLEVAAETLPAELQRLGPAGEAALAQQYDCTVAALPLAYAEALRGPLLSPPGDATTKLQPSLPEVDLRSLAALYWRCSVAVQQMPLAALASLARHHEDIQPLLPPASAPEAERRHALVRAVLPRFAMTCVTRADAEAAAKRKVRSPRPCPCP